MEPVNLNSIRPEQSQGKKFKPRNNPSFDLSAANALVSGDNKIQQSTVDGVPTFSNVDTAPAATATPQVDTTPFYQPEQKPGIRSLENVGGGNRGANTDQPLFQQSQGTRGLENSGGGNRGANTDQSAFQLALQPQQSPGTQPQLSRMGPNAGVEPPAINPEQSDSIFDRIFRRKQSIRSLEGIGPYGRTR